MHTLRTSWFLFSFRCFYRLSPFFLSSFYVAFFLVMFSFHSPPPSFVSVFFSLFLLSFLPSFLSFFLLFSFFPFFLLMVIFLAFVVLFLSNYLISIFSWIFLLSPVYGDVYSVYPLHRFPSHSLYLCLFSFFLVCTCCPFSRHCHMPSCHRWQYCCYRMTIASKIRRLQKSPA